MNRELRILNRFVACLALVICASCSGTIAPKENTPKAVAYIGNSQNAGVLGFEPDGSVIITSAKRDEYNSLIDSYGTRFTPPLAHDAGLRSNGPDSSWLIDREHVVKFSVMRSWQRRGDKI